MWISGGGVVVAVLVVVLVMIVAGGHCGMRRRGGFVLRYPLAAGRGQLRAGRPLCAADALEGFVVGGGCGGCGCGRCCGCFCYIFLC